MPRIIAFSDCVARPPEEERTFPLMEHLRKVGEQMAKLCPLPELSPIYRLAGLCHDIYKAHPDWQTYVLSRGAIRKGPPHAAAGAFLFSWLAYQWLTNKGLWPRYRLLWLRMARDIADHHGRLDALLSGVRLEWLQKYEWDRLDMHGIKRFLAAEIPEVAFMPMEPDSLIHWIGKANRIAEEMLFDELDAETAGDSPLRLMRSLQEWRQATTVMIAADRFSVHPIPNREWSSVEADEAYQNLQSKLAELNSGAMRSIRSEMQAKALDLYRTLGCPQWVTIGLPTGYGKTLLSFRLALEMIRYEGFKKIIYVAPYLSILEQASQAMHQTFGQFPLEHHSLAILHEEQPVDMEEKDTVTSFSALTMESWAHSLVCTSFQQFSKMLFPERAQHVLRRSALNNSVVILDEPQIFRPEGWNLVLTGLEAAAELYNMKVIFLSATMPPMRYGLQTEPVELCPNTLVAVNRYRLECFAEPVDQQQLALLLQQRQETKRAAILNTVRDAQLVYKEMEHSNDTVCLLHGGMIPIHKKVRIGEMRSWLKDPQCRLTVIATQIIEAGVDISFPFVFRANAILPSIVQAAGRVNRHSEGPQGTILVRPFLRDGNLDTRKYIYRQDILRQLTDELLLSREIWFESELRDLLKNYYERMFHHNSYQTCLQNIAEAYSGNWPVLGSFEPFEEEPYKLPVFVPWDVPEEMAQWIPEHYLYLLKRFRIDNANGIYERYQDRNWLRSLSFEERKNFMILFHYHVVNLPGRMATRAVGKDDYLQLRVPCLMGAHGYSTDTGWLMSDDTELQFI